MVFCPPSPPRQHRCAPYGDARTADPALQASSAEYALGSSNRLMSSVIACRRLARTASSNESHADHTDHRGPRGLGGQTAMVPVAASPVPRDHQKALLLRARRCSWASANGLLDCIRNHDRSRRCAPFGCSVSQVPVCGTHGGASVRPNSSALTPPQPLRNCPYNSIWIAGTLTR